MIIALGSDRAAKLASVRDCITRIATIEPAWSEVTIIGRPVVIQAPAMPLSDKELMDGAEERASAVRTVIESEGLTADLFVGLEGGFNSVVRGGERITFLRGWAYASNGEHGYFGCSPSIAVPGKLSAMVIEGGIELGVVIDKFGGENDIRSRQGAWGVLSRDLLTRSMSFETALLAALAPFYNIKSYSDRPLERIASGE